jgi:hypothetical protein
MAVDGVGIEGSNILTLDLTTSPTAPAAFSQSRLRLQRWALPPLHDTGSGSSSRAAVSMLAAGGGKGRAAAGKKQQPKKPQEGLLSLRFPWDGGGASSSSSSSSSSSTEKRGGSGGRKVKAKKEEKGFNLFGGLFGGGGGGSSSSGSPAAAAATNPPTRSGEKEKEKEGLFAGFLDFNSEWKGQLSLQRRIKKLEKEVAKDYIRGDRAK